MPSRVLTFNQRPWQGGLNTAVDPALLSPDELTRAENIVFSTSGARKRRDGFGLWDHIATGVSRASSGTTRTIVLNINSGFSLNVDDVISVRHSSALDTEYDVKKASIASVDTVTYSPNVAITYEMSESLTEAATADSDIRIGRWESERVIGIYDYWYYSSGSKIQKIVGVTSDGNFYQYTTAGSKTAISTSGLTLSSPLSNCSFVTLGNKLIVAFDGEANKPVIWDGTSAITHISNTDWEGNDIQATNPTPSLEKLRVHQSRIFATVSGDPDRIHYCDVNNPQRWNGEGDSGALEVATGDGDSTGFSAIFPSFKGRLGVAKGNKLYQLIGEAPLQAVELISDGIGSQAHGACVAVDQDDVVFISQRGIHSFAATDQFGDFAGSFLSQKIQPDFNDLNLSKQQYFKGIYMPSINSVAFVMEETGYTSNNVIYLYNVLGQQWYTWRNTQGEFQIDSLSTYQNNNRKKMLAGLVEGRILEYDEDNEHDFVQDSVYYDVQSGIIYPDNDTTKIKGFKQVGILYKTERDSVDFTVRCFVDNFEEQTHNITQTPDGDLLGAAFVLGASELGFDQILLPENFSIDGYGFGMKIRITSSNPLEIYAYTIDFEPAGDQRAVIR